jgi:hypothetical protein
MNPLRRGFSLDCPLTTKVDATVNAKTMDGCIEEDMGWRITTP